MLISNTMRQGHENPGICEKLIAMGTGPIDSTPEEFGAFRRSSEISMPI